MRITLKTLATATAFSFFVSAPVFALAPCDQVVVDTAGVLKDIPAIEAAAAKLAALTDADVRVRIEPDYGSFRNLDAHVENIADTVCAEEWSNDVGTRDRYSNLIMFWVTMNRQIGIYYGDSWRKELSSRWVSIKDDKIIPSLRDGNFDRAFIRGIEETARVIERAQQPTAPTIVQRETVRETVRVEQREPTDFGPLAQVLMFLAVVLAGALAVWLVIVPLWKQYDRNRAMRRKAQGVVALCYEQYRLLNSRSQWFEQLFGKDKEAKLAPEWANQSIFTGWRNEYLLLAEKADGVNTAIQMLESGPYEQAGTHQEYQVVYDQLFEKLKELKEIAEAMQALAEKIQTVEGLANNISEIADKTKATIEAARKIIDEAETGDGQFKVNSERLQLKHADSLFIKATAYTSEKLYNRANETFQEVVAVATKAKASAQGLPALRDSLRVKWEALNTHRQRLLDRVPTTKAAFDSMEAQYAQSSLEAIAGNGAEAEKLLKVVPKMSKAINGLLNDQEWQQAEAALGVADGVLDSISALLDAIMQLGSNLAALVSDTTDECKEAEESIEAATAFLRSNRKYDSPQHQKRLREASRLLSEAKKEASKPKPDYPVAYKLAAEADGIADQVFAVAQQGKTRDEERRRRAERARREALAELDTADRYVKNHRSDVTSRAKRKLAEAQGLVAALEAASEVEMILQLASRLNSQREAAFNLAKKDFRSAESTRAAARRRRSETFSSSTSSYGGSSSSGGFGGGSSGFGGGGGFGGGSSSW